MDKTMRIAVILSAYDKMSTVVNSAVDKAQHKLKGMDKFRDKLNSFGNVAAIGGGIATAFLGGTIKAAEESEVAGNRIKQVFKSMGEQNDNAANAALDYANKLQMQIGVEDEVIAATQAKIATFKSVSDAAGRMAGVFDRATAAAFDMQATGFGEASQNAVQLGKALEDPIKGITSLRKSGITFTAAERQKIQALVDSNKKLEAQKLILAAVEKQVKGVAAATAPASAKMAVAWSEVSESIGKSLLPSVQDFTNYLTTNVIPNVQEFTDKHPELIKYIGIASVSLLGLGVAAKVVSFVMGGLGPVITAVSTAVKFMGNTISIVGKFLMANPILIAIGLIAAAVYLIYDNWESITAWFGELWDTVCDAFSSAWKWIKNMFLDYTPYGLIIKHWESISAWFGQLWDSVTAVFTGVWDGIKQIFVDYNPATILYSSWQAIVEWFQNLWQKVKDIFANAWQGIKDSVASAFGFGDDDASKAAAAYEKSLNAVNQRTSKVIGFDANSNVSLSGGGMGAALRPVPVNSSSINYSPVIHYTGPGGVQGAADFTAAVQDDFKKQMAAYKVQQARVAF